MKHFFAIALILSIFSCSNPTQGMFYSIEKEKKTGDASNNLPNTISVGGVAVFKDTTMYLTARSLYKKTTTSDWETISLSTLDIPYSTAYDVETSGATGDRLYLLVGSTDGPQKIYTSTDGASFTEVSITGISGSPIDFVKIQNDTANILVNFSDNQAYALSDTTLSTQKLLPTDKIYSSPVSQATKDGTDYQMVNKNYLFTGTDFNGTLTRSTPTTAGGASLGDLGGIIYSDYLTGISELIISTNRGTLIHKNGGNWEAFAPVVKDINSKEIKLGGLTEYSLGGTDLLLVCTVGNGYVEARKDGGVPVMTTPQITVTENFINSTFGTKTTFNFITFNNQLYSSSLSGFWKLSGNSWDWE